MSVREIFLLGNPTLRKKCEAVKNFTGTSLQPVAADLRDTLADFRKTHGFGRGIAAPQIGVLQRVIFVNADAPILMVNPRIVRRSRSVMTLWDDCFSFPDILVRVRRRVAITMEYRDAGGMLRSLKATGPLSELLQHEIDHIDGILAIDRAIDSKHIVLRSEWEKLFSRGKTSLEL